MTRHQDPAEEPFGVLRSWQVGVAKSGIILWKPRSAWGSTLDELLQFYIFGLMTHDLGCWFDMIDVTWCDMMYIFSFLPSGQNHSRLKKPGSHQSSPFSPNELTMHELPHFMGLHHDQLVAGHGRSRWFRGRARRFSEVLVCCCIAGLHILPWDEEERLLPPMFDEWIDSDWRCLKRFHDISPHLTRFDNNIYRTFSVDWMGCIVGSFQDSLSKAKLFHCINCVPGAMYAESLSGKRMQRVTPAEQQVVKIAFLAPSLVIWSKGAFLNHSKNNET